MRALLTIVLLASALWGGYWAVGARMIEDRVTAWFAAQDGRPLEARQAGVDVQGFPNRFDLTVTEPALADPASGIGWAAPFVQVFAMTWKPWHLIAALPQEQTLTLPGEEIRIASSRLRGSLVLVPGLEARLDRATVEGDGLALSSSRGWRGAAARVMLASRSGAEDGTVHDLWAEATSITPDQAFRMALAALSDLPELVDRVAVDSTLRFDAPLQGGGVLPPRLTGVTLREARVDWGKLRLAATGDVVADAQGRAEGEVTVTVEPWRDLVPVLVAAGRVTPEMAPTVERWMGVMAAGSGRDGVLEMVLTMRDGRMSFGPFPLGPAPVLAP